MQTRIALGFGVVGLVVVMVVAVLNPAAVRTLLAVVALVAFVWSAVAFLNPTWGPLPSRTAGVVALVAGIALWVAACRW